MGIADTLQNLECPFKLGALLMGKGTTETINSLRVTGD
jgi:hypothetical protein